ncbi:hypothetical protein OQH61_08720 [Helicobacter sp. MIT 21-1697]|uniref:hypothetical protein n=1 Tax=Helicobacter sp. MIT 21-1697 TaxID=2993733 RepID=UPI00224B1D10|nr:hypothetical protein [Helicobacter sp. MIT 21-1697]MCX2717813.1 hypothetical protein [Helicobacter sp. MIT 21-1697]
MLSDFFEQMLALCKDCIPLTHPTITQSGNYLLFEGCEGFGEDVETYHYKILIAGHSLNASDAGIILKAQEILHSLKRHAFRNGTLKVRHLTLSQINEGLFVYEMKIELKVRR